MDKPNKLLKVISILFFVQVAVAVLDIVTGHASSPKSPWEWLYRVAGPVLALAGGIVGLKGRYAAAKVVGIIMLVIHAFNGLVGILVPLQDVYEASQINGSGFYQALVNASGGVVLPILYLWGVHKGPAPEK